jgi:hypothetical protein
VVRGSQGDLHGSGGGVRSPIRRIRLSGPGNVRLTGHCWQSATPQATARPPELAVKVRREQLAVIDLVSNGDAALALNRLTCVGTAGFEPATP